MTALQVANFACWIKRCALPLTLWGGFPTPVFGFCDAAYVQTADAQSELEQQVLMPEQELHDLGDL